MNEEETASYIITYLGIKPEDEESVRSIVHGAFPFYQSLPELIEHVKQVLIDYAEMTKPK